MLKSLNINYQVYCMWATVTIKRNYKIIFSFTIHFFRVTLNNLILAKFGWVFKTNLYLSENCKRRAFKWIVKSKTNSNENIEWKIFVCICIKNNKNVYISTYLCMYRCVLIWTNAKKLFSAFFSNVRKSIFIIHHQNDALSKSVVVDKNR